MFDPVGEVDAPFKGGGHIDGDCGRCGLFHMVEPDPGPAFCAAVYKDRLRVLARRKDEEAEQEGKKSAVIADVCRDVLPAVPVVQPGERSSKRRLCYGNR